jgi:hypothetical protein
MPFHANRSHVPCRTSTAIPAIAADWAVETRIVKTIGSERREFPTQMLAEQHPRKSMVESIPGFSGLTLGLDSAVVGVPEVEVNLKGARQGTSNADPTCLRVGPSKETRPGGCEFLVSGGNRRSRESVAQ